MYPAIRLARDSDLSELAALVEAYWSFEKIQGFDRSRITTLLRNFLQHPHRGQCWVADLNGQIVGYLLLVFLFSLEHGGTMAEIDEFFVSPDQRSSNIGTGLLDAASRAMAREGIAHVQLQLATTNSRGRVFYERHGYRSLSGCSLLAKALR